MKTLFSIGGIAAVLLIGGIWWTSALQEENPDVISHNGLHSHPKLTISVRGELIEIPHNLGLGAVHNPVHTHDDVPIIHLEFGGRVTTSDVTLGKFFEIWGKDMRSFGSNMHMTVNGKENTEYEKYIMRDGDVIELQYD